jgi:AraC-like DNA-binding protein
LYWGPGRLIYFGLGGPAEWHRHHAVQMVVSLDAPVVIRVAGRPDPFEARAAIVPSGSQHEVESSGRRVLLVLTEPYGPAGAGVAGAARHLAGRDIGYLLPQDVTGRWLGEEDFDILGFATETLAAIAPSPEPVLHLSDAVQSALSYLERSIPGHPRLGEAAREANISPSRLTHLFTEEVGIPFRRFALWLRLRRAAEEGTRAATLTDAAMAAGFSDLPHLSRVCRQTFGVSPSVVLGMEVIPTGLWARSSGSAHSTGTFKPVLRVVR